MAKEKIIISDEAQAAQLLDQLLTHPEKVDTTNIEIKDWKHFTLYLQGEKFDNSLTPTVMKGIIELQKAVYEAYALAVYNDKNTNRLSRQEKNALELKVVVYKGSSIVDIDINDVFSKFIEGTVGKMSSQQAFILIFVALLLYFGTSALGKFLEHRQAIKEKELEAEQAKSNQESLVETVKNVVESHNKKDQKVLEVLEKAIEQNPKAQQIERIAIDTTNAIVRSTRNAETAIINDTVEMSGETAEFLTRSVRVDWQPVRIDGNYRLLRVNSSNTRQRKVTMLNLDNGKEITATLEDNTIGSRHLQLLGDAEWNLHPAKLKVKAKMKGEQFKDAQIISVESVDKSVVFDDSDGVEEE
jgi:F0F1-type ATP synthase membrane subunit b/b'